MERNVETELENFCVFVLPDFTDCAAKAVRNCIPGYIALCYIIFRLLEVDECASNPCVNNGTCHDGRGDFSCDCIPGYEGKTCAEGKLGISLFYMTLLGIAIEINECDSDPCFNGGVCADKFLGFSCNCSDGFEGLRCETSNWYSRNLMHSSHMAMVRYKRMR